MEPSSPDTTSSRSWLLHLPRLALGALFLYAGGIKLFTMRRFSENLGEFGIVPDALVTPAAWLVCLLEVMAGFGLVVKFRGSLALIASLLLAFVGVLIYGIALGLDIDCGCLGPGYHVGLHVQLLIDLGLLLLCGLVYWTWPPGKEQPVAAPPEADTTA